MRLFSLQYTRSETLHLNKTLNHRTKHEPRNGKLRKTENSLEWSINCFHGSIYMTDINRQTIELKQLFSDIEI